MVDSALAGVEKPDPRLFHAALDALDGLPDEALYVGDLYDVEVVGARAAGMDAILLGSPPAEGAAPCRTIPSIEELVNQILSEVKR